MAKKSTETAPAIAQPVMIDVKQVAAMLGCSTRHVTRLEEAEQMPPAIKLGRLCRWQREVILKWIAAGCPDLATWEQSQQVKA